MAALLAWAVVFHSSWVGSRSGASDFVLRDVQLHLSARRTAVPRARAILMPPVKRAKKADALADVESASPEVTKPAAAAKKARKTVDPETVDSAAALQSWLVESGASLDKVRIEEREPGDLGWGLRAKAAVAQGDVIATIPARCVLRVEAKPMATLLEGMGVAIPDGLWELPLALRLASEYLDPSSEWADYVRSLPGSFSSIPLVYRDDELRALKSQWIVDRVFEQRDLIDELVAAAADSPSAAVRRTFATAPPSLSDMRWAAAAAASRALPIDGAGGKQHALVPLLDLCNHAHEPSCELRCDSKSGDVKLLARRPLAADSPLTIDYGDTGSAHRMLRYGFVEPDDPRDFLIAEFDSASLDIAHGLGEPKPMSAGHAGGAAGWEPTQSPQIELAQLEEHQRAMLAQLGVLAPAEGQRPREMLRFHAAQLDGRLLAALRVVYAESEAELQGLSPEELCSTERILDDALEEKVRQTAVGWAMLVAGSLASAGLTAGLGGGIGRTDSHMLVSGRVTVVGALTSNGRTALDLRKAQMQTSIAALRYAKCTLMHALPLTSVFAERPSPAEVADEARLGTDGFDDEEVDLEDFGDLQYLERDSTLSPQLADLDSY